MMILDALILKMYDAEGNYTGPSERVLFVNGEMINIDDYAAASNGRLVLPDAGE
jgi:hypothetical protein